MATFYKHDISDWREGTASLSDRAYRVYHVIIEEIMLNEGPIALHERSLAGKANRSIRDFRAALDELISLSKVSVVGGFINNFRAEIELKSIRNNRENAANGGRNSGKVRRNSVENDKKAKHFKGDDEATLHKETNIYRQEEDLDKNKNYNIDDNAREEADLEGSLREAAGDCIHAPSPGLMVMSKPLAWIDAGCSLEHDILPAIRATAARSRKNQIKSWAYFDAAVMQAFADRTAAVDLPEPTPIRPPRSPPKSFERIALEERQEQSRKIFENLKRTFGDGDSGAGANKLLEADAISLLRDAG